MKVVIFKKGELVNIVFNDMYMATINEGTDSDEIKFALLCDVKYVHRISPTLTKNIIKYTNYEERFDDIQQIIQFIVNYYQDKDKKYILLGYNSAIGDYTRSHKDVFKAIGFKPMSRREYDYMRYDYNV